MNYLTLEHITKSYGEKILFHDIDFNISKGQKIALIAKNGSGKTTLLKIIAQEEAPEGEQAKIILNKDIRIGYLPQEPEFHPDDNVLEAALDSELPEIKAIKAYELALLKEDQEDLADKLSAVEDLAAWDIETRIKEVLGKLKLHDLSQSIKTLSGGQKKRLALAKLIIDDPEFLILDEPTNHLDIDMIEWLEKYFAQQNITLFMVTHDRYFLERVCNEIVEIDDGKLFIYRGNYSDYLEKKSNRIQSESARMTKVKRLFSKELDWIRRQPKARTTKAKSRIDKFYEIKEEAKQKVDTPLQEIHFEPRRLGTKIIELHHISKSFEDIKIVDGFSYKFAKGEKVGIAGPNGVGKTSFIKLLTGELKPDSGKVILGDTVEFGHYNQDGIQLSADKTVIEVIRDVAEYIPLKKGMKMTAESLLERFLFPRPQQSVYVSKLSGGEKRRLLLLRTLMKNPNFLILDEPTNDLDVLTINVLEDYLMQFPGCLIVISHDRYFMDKIIDHLFIMEGEGQVKDYNGSYSSYKRSKGPSQDADQKIKKEKPRQEVKPKEAEEKRKLSYFEKKEYNDLPEMIEKLELEKKNIEAAFLEPNLSSDKISSMSQRLGEIAKEVDEKENRWLELSEFM